MNPQDILRDLATFRALLLQRAASGFIRELDSLIDDMAAEMERILQNASALDKMALARLDKQVHQIAAVVDMPPPDLSELAAIEAAAAVKDLAKVGVTAVLPAPAILEKIANNSTTQGALLPDWFAQLESKTRFEVARTLRAGVALGRTNQQLIDDLIGTQRTAFGAEPLKKAAREAEAIVRTAVMDISNQAALATFEENSDVIKGVEYVSTLDSRTTLQCMAYDGAAWTLQGRHIGGPKVPFRNPPLHWRCRSRLVPITKTFRELGIDRDEIPAGTRSSAYGQISSKIKFEAWMNSQGADFADEMLGNGRYELYKKGNLTLSQLIDPRTLKPLTLDELRNKYGI